MKLFSVLTKCTIMWLVTSIQNVHAKTLQHIAKVLQQALCLNREEGHAEAGKIIRFI